MNLRILLTTVFLLKFVSCEELVNCNKVHDTFNVCKKNGVLVFVNETINESGLSITDSDITEIAPNAFQDLDIAELRLNFNGRPVKLYPASFEGLHKVETLVIQWTEFSPQYKLFDALSALRSLTISNCQVGDLIHGTFYSLSRLRELYLNYNNISTLTYYQNTFDIALGSVTNLWLDHNQLSNIEPNVFFTLTSLRKLHLNNNRLKTLLPGTFHGIGNVWVVELQYNELTSIPKNLFNELHRLTHLYLHHNKISSIESGAFDGLNLHVLTLSVNKLTIISSSMFTGLRAQDLSLAFNDISRVDDNTFKEVGLDKIVFHDNNCTVDKERWGLSNETVVQ
uniref:Uncharacterized protein n=1 Tax=Bracon brevicornis TaxID=1563983 RepID=A0A6V7I8E9_9HYME